MTVYTSSTAQPQNNAPSPNARDKKGGRKSGRFRSSPRWMKVMIVIGTVLIAASACTGAFAWTLMSRYENKVSHQDILGNAALPKEQQHWTQGPLNLLLLGSDSRAGETDKGVVAGQRSDTIMLVHIAAARDSAAIVSIPRDSYVDVPAGGDWKGGKNKINAAFAFGGTPLAAKAVTELTGVPLDGAMVVDFAGLRNMVNAVGGVRVCVDYDVKSWFSNKFWAKGCHQMNGADAEEFSRERHNVPQGDISREHQQQLVVLGIMQKVTDSNVFANPIALDKLLTTAAQSLTIDKSLNLQQMAMTVKNIKPANVQFATVPYSNLGLQTPAGSAVQLNMTKAQGMFDAIKGDTINQWLIANPPQTRGSS